jgi:cytochrome c biogenesis protein CcmG/thiol:disulfide interchange protein DsbE
VLNFWASWCKPCEEEAAALETAWQKYRDQGVMFVGVDYLDQEPSAKRYLDKFQVSYPNGPDLASKISKRYTIRGVPETFFINAEGELVGCRKIGPLVPGELDQRIAEIMP